ncbi:Putative formate dehydrogenase oxidoreductase protein [Serinicoccus hydrothermalis]|uniref:Formate dehydrogenase oxidoreductase protein n=1 Tax=Serinicoccus hydrothermalis TaxID=1758689 RepID=A0A1B1NDJ0_9MICO|nr:FdhF/YdeP family oxidoreductase [Serinicoccus hydrothermalis]ANS79484.1 Putative formate dehydrogenase oxidoreductase protein [Serinicoccus hydrothermalis]
MATDAPRKDFTDDDLEIHERKDWAAGIPGVYHALKISYEQMGAVRTLRTLTRLNQKHGFDCSGCAWPDPDHRSPAEFCENGAKAVAEEATLRTIGPDFFEEHDLDDLATRSDWWLGQQGRLVHPVVKRADSNRYEPISWDDAFRMIAEQLTSLADPDEAIFYTSGRTSNEAAFVYQLMVRAYGTNNLPDCSNMCHEASGAALGDTIGLGKGTVLLEDLHKAELIIIAGQNPGTNHPRMLSALEKAKDNGAAIVAVNPLPEAGLQRFKNPQNPIKAVGSGTDLADDFLQIRLGGDMALFQALGALLLEREDADPGSVLDHEFLAEYTEGLEAYREHLADLDWDEVLTATGLERQQIEDLADRLARSRRTVVCWAMGLTQHEHSVAMLTEVVNVILLQGNIGRDGAGLCPVRGHSNVQGDRTMGIWEQMPDDFHDRLDAEFSFESPREHGYDTAAAVEAMREGRVSFFMGMGGNFAKAAPDTDVTEAALRRCDLTVQVSTKLNRSHVVTGETALILPVLARSERDEQASGPQRVTVEDSMSAVHASHGPLPPASPYLLSEVAVICRLARSIERVAAVTDWQAFEDDYRTIRDAVSRVIPGFEDYEDKINDPGGFVLPHVARTREWGDTQLGKAQLSCNELVYPKVPEGRLLLQTLRSHDQFNTTIYGLDDRYRGIENGRRVVFVNPADLDERGLRDGQHVDLVSHWEDGERVAEEFRIVSYDTAPGCAAAYYPETNVLVPLGQRSKRSGTPASKSVVVELRARA